MLFTPYEVELLKGAIQMFDLRPESFNDSKDAHRKLSNSCSYKLTHLNNLTCFTENEIEFLTAYICRSRSRDPAKDEASTTAPSGDLPPSLP